MNPGDRVRVNNPELLNAHGTSGVIVSWYEGPGMYVVQPDGEPNLRPGYYPHELELENNDE